MKKIAVTLAGLALLAAAGSAFALPVPFAYNNRPVTITDTPTQTTLQQVIDATVGSGVISAANDQSRVGAWYLAEQDTDAYRVALLSPLGSGQLGIFSLLTGAKYDMFTATPAPSSMPNYTVNFLLERDDITGKYSLYVNNTLKDPNFGTAFGFYWKEDKPDPDHYSYTLDTMNGTTPTARALSYVVPDHSTVTTHRTSTTSTISNSEGNNDWILAFDNYQNNLLGDVVGAPRDSITDFNDAVFYLEDMNPVPEPGTILLLGAGLLGLGLYGRKRMKA